MASSTAFRSGVNRPRIQSDALATTARETRAGRCGRATANGRRVALTDWSRVAFLKSTSKAGSRSHYCTQPTGMPANSRISVRSLGTCACPFAPNASSSDIKFAGEQTSVGIVDPIGEPLRFDFVRPNSGIA
jgi:hypothetical protein